MVEPPAGRPLLQNRVLFERLVWTSFGFALFQGALQLMPSLDVSGWAISLTKFFISPVISLLVALAVSRLRSRVAAVVFILSVLASMVLAYFDLVEGYWRNIPFVLGAMSILLDFVAAVLISKWFANGEF